MKKILKAIGWLVLAVVILAGLGAGYLTLGEYRPSAVEPVGIAGDEGRAPKAGDALSAVSFNIGYCGLPAEADFFMDGGTLTRVGSKDIIKRDLDGVTKALEAQDADLTLLQEVDRGSKRSYDVNEADALHASLGGQSAFAANFLCPYVPIPVLDPIGKVDSGVATLSKLATAGASRISLPSPFSWPMSTCNLKRCLLVTRIPLEGSERELVVVNLHLEAYDDGAGKAAQTRVLVDFLSGEYEKGNYVVAGGDFNQWLPGVDTSRYPISANGSYQPGTVEASILPDGWTFAADDTAPTCRLLSMPYDAANPAMQYYVIDGFILSPNVQLTMVQTLPMDFRYSDHNPVRIEFALKP